MNNAIILAAGQGKRMKSQTSKVLHKVGNKYLLQHVVDVAKNHVEKMNIIVGHNSQSVKSAITESKINWVLQEKQLGTGHAVKQAIPFIEENSICLILYADVPLLQSKTIEELLKKARTNGFSLLSVVLNDPFGYGRIIRDTNGLIKSIVEQKDASETDLKIKEINTGIMALKGSLLKKYLNELKTNNAQGEFYLTDIVEIAVKDNVNIASFICESADEVMGINDKKQLSQAERLYQMKQAENFMSSGLTLMDPSRFDCRGNLKFGDDCTIDINVVFEGDNVLGNNVLISPNCIIKDSKIGDNAVILPNSIIENSTIGSCTSIGPFARIRPDTTIGNHSKVGNFVEIKKSSVSNNSKISHLSYVGDSKIGSDVNIGAGVITCNYDGSNKHQTEIKDGAFIGSNSQLVAPVSIGKNATIGAGSTIAQNAPDNKLTVSRNKQSTIDKWKRPQKK